METNQLTEMLRPYVAELVADAHDNKNAADTIKWYEMHRRCPGDPGARVVCEEAFKAWKAAKK